MTVEELIAKLSTFDPKALVFIDYQYISGELGWSSVEEEEHEIESFEELNYENAPYLNELHLKTF